MFKDCKVFHITQLIFNVINCVESFVVLVLYSRGTIVGSSGAGSWITDGRLPLV